MSRRHRVAVVGGGISGLAAGWALHRRPDPPEVVVLEADDRIGGKLHTASVDGALVELGADAFLAREPDAVDLARAAGLGAALVAPATGRVQIVWRGRRHDLPAGLVLGAPTQLRSLLGSGLLSFWSVARAGLDLVLPRERDVDAMTVHDLVARRFGRQVHDRLVEPLLAGVHAGSTRRLGAVAATPILAEAVRDHRSLLLGLRRRPAGDGGPMFLTVRGGLSRLVERLARDLDVRTSTPVRLVEQHGVGYRLLLGAGEAEDADGLVLATPAPVSAELLRDLAPAAATALGEIPHASVALVHLVYPPGTVVPEGSGVLIPPREGRTTKAITWVSNKWPHFVSDERVVVRASVGRADVATTDRSDEDLVAAVRDDLAVVSALRGEPRAVRVTRWPDALPQYEVSHLERVGRIDAGVAGLSGIALAGAAYRGLGIAACVRQGQAAADQVARDLERSAAR